MVWKLNTGEARERYAHLVDRIHARPEAEAQAPKPSGTSVTSREPVTATAGLGAVLPGARAELQAPTPAGVHKQEPSFGISPVLTIDSTQEPTPSDTPSAELVRREPLLIAVSEAPPNELLWDIPAFPCDPDELPDLRPAPLPPDQHPGLLNRTANMYGHALRMPADDGRQRLWAEQRRERGFDDTELWGLDDAVARFVLPRLKALRQKQLTPPTSTMELTMWYSLLDKMIRAFELLLPEGGGAWSRGELKDRERAQLQEGLDLFRQHFFHLCW